jgi:hypothetical protein
MRRAGLERDLDEKDYPGAGGLREQTTQNQWTKTIDK